MGRPARLSAQITCVGLGGHVSSRKLFESEGRREFDFLCRLKYIAYVQLSLEDGSYEWWARPCDGHAGGVFTAKDETP